MVKYFFTFRINTKIQVHLSSFLLDHQKDFRFESCFIQAHTQEKIHLFISKTLEYMTKCVKQNLFRIVCYKIFIIDDYIIGAIET